jgi:hypothetical protein
METANYCGHSNFGHYSSFRIASHRFEQIAQDSPAATPIAIRVRQARWAARHMKLNDLED